MIFCFTSSTKCRLICASPAVQRPYVCASSLIGLRLFRQSLTSVGKLGTPSLARPAKTHTHTLLRVVLVWTAFAFSAPLDRQNRFKPSWGGLVDLPLALDRFKHFPPFIFCFCRCCHGCVTSGTHWRLPLLFVLPRTLRALNVHVFFIRGVSTCR